MIGAALTLVSSYNLAMKNDPEYNRLCWHSRRGMLELDLVLGPFVRDCYPSLPPQEQAWYVQLLLSEDQDLFSWLLRRAIPEDAEIEKIVNRILEFTRAEA
jgi:antitoxin CptB